ncbi:MAG: PfkB family carbohydrate kinase [PVC group bacterium]
MNRFDVVGIGRNCIDYLALVSSLPPPDSKVPMKEYRVVGGGQATTALAALSRLGLKTAYVGVVGDDDGGRLVLEGLREMGVDVSGVVVEKGGATPIALIFVDEQAGTRTIAYQPTSPGRLSISSVDLNLILSARCLMVDPHETLFGLEVSKEARKRGIPIIYDAEHLTGGFYEMLAAADYVVGSEDVVQTLKAAGPEEALKKLLSAGPTAAVITLGARGAIALTPEGYVRSSAFRIEVVDTTAAGDAFHAGFAYSVLQGWGMEKTLEFSNALGALVCRGLGGRETLPTLDEVFNFLSW